MAGAGSAFDRNDHRLIERLTRQVGKLADEVERQNDAREATNTEGADPLEQRSLTDLDVIAEISNHALAELSAGDLDALEGSLQAINDRATAWNDPDATTEEGEE
ncbi:hypothetical protein HLRTI_000480 [Halorhabdus tiamatea SARL4B]|uniref:Uncharacterized protein n=1 Tax=Halorhabdus tiamatea SARL4B TaxID=1033806 RepID=F7PLP3_9EURY|nr:hypothetical protein [Halorhabdus tiamatea]ERJ07438.1 hypothetical protein HLRTI_000480 [Halorhabdus tiamatea SARL4B]